MAKLCSAIRPPCCAKEPTPPEASSCLVSAICGSLAREGGLIAPKVKFVHLITPPSKKLDGVGPVDNRPSTD